MEGINNSAVEIKSQECDIKVTFATICAAPSATIEPLASLPWDIVWLAHSPPFSISQLLPYCH